ncbi:MAG TPA: hypothetical protein DCK95_06650 [Anaerolineaceae bacterium]|nr:hypothetical protein [Anaerolineaceae bacterium]
MDKINLKTVQKWGIVFAAFLLLFATPIGLLSDVFAQGQETCPASGDWIKVDSLSGETYTYTAPEGKLIAETCYKAGTEVVFKTIAPPASSVTVISTVGHDLSHASFRLVDEPNPSPTPTEPFTPTPTFTSTPTEPFTPTPTDEFTPTPTDEFTPTPTDEFTPTPTEEFTPTPTDEFTPTPTDEFTPTPTEEFTPTPTEEMEFVPLTISGLCSGAVASIGAVQTEENTITWRVSNNNNQAVSFTWTANNGQSGSATAPANGSTSFITAIDGSVISLEYFLNEEPMKERTSIDPCEAQQETQEPTPTQTEEVTPTEDSTEDPTALPTDSQPDQPAGGSGPSLMTTIIPFMIGISGIAAVSTIVLKNKKEKIS